MFLAAQGVLNGKGSAHPTAQQDVVHATSRDYDCWRPCDGQSARIPTFLATQLLGNNVPGTETKSVGYGSPV